MSKQNTTILSAALVVAVILAAFGAGMYVGQKKVPDVVAVDTLANKETEKPDQVDFSSFWQAWRVLDDKFMPDPEAVSATSTVAMATSTSATSTVKKIKRLSTTEDRVWGAIEGMTKALGDPYTTFFPPKENKSFNEELSGEFGGVGMEVGLRKNVLTVIAPIEGSPAMRAGVKAGDAVLAIDGASTADLSVEEAVRKIRGPKGTKVKLTILHDKASSTTELSVMRDTIQVPTIKTAVYDQSGKPITPETGLRPGGVFVIKLMSFTSQSPELFRNALIQFNANNTDKLIIDLRGNPGGFLDAAVSIASWFLPEGDVVVTEKFGHGGGENVHRSKGFGHEGEKLKLAVLIDKGSASASEILAGALQDHKTAVLVGEQSFGKGSVQELVPLDHDASMKVTVARWFTPNDHSISEKGLTPDYIATSTDKDLEAGKDQALLKAIHLLSK